MTGNRRFYAILIGEMKALELMKTHVVKTSPDATLGQAIDLMDLYYVTGLPVVDDDQRICGLLTDADVLRAVSETFVNGSDDQRQRSGAPFVSLPVAQYAADRLVGDFMQRRIITISEHDDVSGVIDAFVSGTTDQIPVLDSSSRVVGMLSRVDILQALFEEQFS